MNEVNKDLPQGVKKAFGRRGDKLTITYTCDTIEARDEAVRRFKEGFDGLPQWYSVEVFAPNDEGKHVARVILA